MQKGQAPRLPDPSGYPHGCSCCCSPWWSRRQIGNPRNATYKYVNYYELLGERVNVDSFAVMVRSVARKLYELDGTVIEQMASNLEPFPTWASPVFAYDKAAIRNPVKLKKDADIYISTGYSAYDCICFIRALLKKYNLDIEEDFVYSARQNKGNEKELDRLEIAKEWCETRRAAGSICYDEVNSQRRYVRFTTPTLNSLIPESTEKLSPWKTKNFYFYEITNYKGEFFVQLYFYCQNLTKEMKDAFVRLSDICGLGDLAKGYKLYFKSTAFQNNDDDTKEVVSSQLDSIFEEIRAFETNASEK